MADVEGLIGKVLEGYKTAVYARDVAALMRLYAPNVRVFDTWGIWSYEGAPAWQVAVEGWFSSLGTERVNVTFDDLQTSGTPDLAFASAFVTYAGLSAEGQPLRSMQNRLSWVLAASGPALRIVHEHTSAPVGFEDAKAILLREKSE